MSATPVAASQSLAYRQIPGDYAVCRLPVTAALPPPPGAGFHCRLLSGGEWTVYCTTERVPAEAVQVQAGWALLELDGAFDFDVVGVMAAWTAPLAAARIPVMALSSFATDYLLLQHAHLLPAHAALAGAGFTWLDDSC